MLTIGISICPGRDSHPDCEVWERLDVSLSYRNFMLHGEKSKFIMLPGSHPLARTHSFEDKVRTTPSGFPGEI